MQTLTAIQRATISSDEALRIVQPDAARVYGDLQPYRISIQMSGDAWFIEYELADPRMKGGGPHYVVDAHTGEIRSKRYQQ